MAYFLCKGRQFKAYITVQTNPNVYVGATISGKTFAGTANANGVVTIMVKKKGTYTVANSNGTSTTVAVLQHGRTYTCDIVTVGTPTCNVATWATNTACCYWSWGGSYHSGMKVYRNNSEVYSGNGSSLNLTNTQTVTGATNGSLTSGTTYTYKFKQFYTVNGRTFYGSEVSKTYTAVSCAGTSARTSTGNWTVPTGVRSIQVFLVGGGGGGGGSVYGDGTSYGAGGGGGGYTYTSGQLSVLPGQTILATIGAGGAAGAGASYYEYGGNTNGGAGGQTKFAHPSGTLSANGGGGGTKNTGEAGNVSGGSGGSAGGTGAKDGGAGGTGQSFNGTYYNGGGGGGGNTSYGAGGTRGGGHGAMGNMNDVAAAVAGTANTGGGGGGASGRNRSGYKWSNAGAAGASGVVVIKYS